MSQYTPNVVVQNPAVRKVAQWVIGIALLVLPVLSIIEANTGLDFAVWLPAATQATAFLAGVFGLAVIVPNIPKSGPDLAMYESVANQYADDGDGETFDLGGDAEDTELGKHGVYDPTEIDADREFDTEPEIPEFEIVANSR